jgi:hypothetical protein
MRLIVQLAIVTAQRRDEVGGARKSELHGLDTEKPVWKITGDETHRGLVIEGRTKNGREQIVPLSKQAAALFRKAVELSKDKEFVFPADMKRVKIGRKPSTPHINGDSVTKAVIRMRNSPISEAANTRRAAERAVIAAERTGEEAALRAARVAVEAAKLALKEAKPISDFTIHDTRRAMPTWLKNQGVSRDVRDLALTRRRRALSWPRQRLSQRRPIRELRRRLHLSKRATVALFIEHRRARALQAMAELDAELAREEPAKRRNQAKRKAGCARRPCRSSGVST